uniref:Recep_L_domain domain-containing protein n=2 Tax=Caenorhabditis tropicalis TaxID=1561998 RepID=A0A1I7V1T6_9PELO
MGFVENMGYKFIYQLSIVRNHPDFCLSTREVQAFAEAGTRVSEFEGKLCSDAGRKDGEVVCYWGNLNSMASDCQHMIGEVVIDANNEKSAWKLKNMTNIYGTLTIQGTNELVDLSFLSSLRQIASLKSIEPRKVQVFRILSNKKLQRIALPEMKTPPFPILMGDYTEIDGNTLELIKDRRYCYLFEKLTQTKVKYNGKRCKKLTPSLEYGTPDLEGWEWQVPSDEEFWNFP